MGATLFSRNSSNNKTSAINDLKDLSSHIKIICFFNIYNKKGIFE